MIIVIVALVLPFANAAPGQGRQDPRIAMWLRGDAFQAAIDAEILEVSWQDTSLREGLQRLGASQRVAIWLDRRVDPQQRVTAAAQRLPLLDTIRQLVRAAGLGVSVVDSIIYVGPSATAQVLATVAAMKREEASSLSGATRGALLRQADWSWDMLSEPNALLQLAATEAGLRWLDASVVPHDLWPAGDYPQTSLSDRLVLLLAGFDSTYLWDAQRQGLTVTALPQTVSLRAAYQLPRRRPGNLDELQRQVPTSRVSVQGNKLWVEGSWEDHQCVRRWLGKPSIKTAATGPGQQRYSLRAVNMAGPLIQEIGRRLKFNVELDPACGDRLKVVVELETQEVSREELIEKILQPAGLTHRWRGQTLLVTPR